MSIWTLMNGAAWALSAVFLALIARDFIKVERRRRAERCDEDAAEDGQR